MNIELTELDAVDQDVFNDVLATNLSRLLLMFNDRTVNYLLSKEGPVYEEAVKAASVRAEKEKQNNDRWLADSCKVAYYGVWYSCHQKILYGQINISYEIKRGPPSGVNSFSSRAFTSWFTLDKQLSCKIEAAMLSKPSDEIDLQGVVTIKNA